MLIQIGSELYRDGIDLTRPDFYTRLVDCEPYPTTTIPSVDVFRQAYENLVDEGATEILSLHITNSLSNMLEVAHTAAAEVRKHPVTVFDSRQVSLGMGFLVESAAEAAAADRCMVEIIESLKDQITRTYVVAILDMLEYLQRSGRMSSAVAGLGRMLKFKPLIKIYDGNPTAESVRTRERATDRLVQTLSEIGPLERIALLHSNAPDRAEDLRRKAETLLPAGDLRIMDITPIIGVHTGPGAVGFACVASRGK